MSARRTFIAILRDDLDACEERNRLLELPSLQSAWEPRWGQAAWDSELVWWFLTAFLDNPAERERIRRAWVSLRTALGDLAALAHAQDGEHHPVSPLLVDFLQRRMVSAMFPTVAEIATGAKRHPAARASANLGKRLTPEDWYGP